MRFKLSKNDVFPFSFFFRFLSLTQKENEEIHYGEIPVIFRRLRDCRVAEVAGFRPQLARGLGVVAQK